jgi:hypothetical protein
MSGTEAGARRDKKARADSIWTTLILGLPLSFVLIKFLQGPQFAQTDVARYLEHPVEYVEITLFCCCLSALCVKLLGCLRQRGALRAELLPAWDGEPQAPAEATHLLAGLSRLPRRVQNSWVGRRCREVLDYLCRRGSAVGLDDHVRFATDNASMALDTSYSFTRFLIWATPILGFLGTVIGISKSIAGVSPEQLERGLTAITGGLATAFDTTGLALMLTMLMMLCSFVVEQLEQRTLQDVDDYVDQHLFHRFARPGGEQEPLLEAMQGLVKRQAEVWAASLAETERRAHTVALEQQEQLTAGLALAIQHSLTVHQDMLSQMRQAAREQASDAMRPLGEMAESLRRQQDALVPVVQQLHELGQALARLQDNEQQLIRVQHLLQQNLGALAASGTFEEAVHSLTAAAHLLTARSSGLSGALRVVDDRDAA